MSFDKIPFKMTAYGAEKTANLLPLSKHNLGIFPEQITPFTAGWAKTDMPGAASRFTMPSLFFEGQEVARLGFRGTEGFIMIRRNIPEQVVNAVRQRFSTIVEMGKRNSAMMADISNATVQPFRDLFPSASGPGGYIHVDVEGVNTIDMVNFFRRRLGQGSHIETRGHQADVSMIDPQHNLSIKVLTFTPTQQRYENRATSATRLTFVSKPADPTGAVRLIKKEIQALCREAADAPFQRVIRDSRPRMPQRGFSVDNVLKRFPDGCVDPETGILIRSQNTKRNGMLMEHDGLLLAVFSQNGENIFLIDHTAALPKTQTTRNGLQYIARNILMDNFVAPQVVAAERAARKPEVNDAWVDSLTEAVRTTDLGYA